MTNLATALKNKIKGMGTVKYQAAPETLQSRQAGDPVQAYRNQQSKMRKATAPMKQYGDKGYKPSTGKGVGY